MRRPSPAMIVALAALFVALGGVGVAATGDTFILGQSNSASTSSSLSAPIAGGKALQLTNTDTSNAASTALGLTVASNHAPFTVNTGVKVTNLNSDRLDGFDSSYFLSKTGKAADSDQLDGLDASAFTQGGAHIYSAHVENRVITGQFATLLSVPGGPTVKYQCASNLPDLNVSTPNTDKVVQYNGDAPFFVGPGQDQVATQGTGAVSIRLLASRAKLNVIGADPSVLDNVVATGGWNPNTSTCSFQTVVEMFG